MSTFAQRKQAAKAAIDLAVRAALESGTCRRAGRKLAFQRLLKHVRPCDLLRPSPSGGRAGQRGHAEIIAGLLALTRFHRVWLLPVEEWTPDAANPLPQFASLARHLLAAYPVPGFMTAVWFSNRGPEARRMQAWFPHIGAGKNIRQADLPLPYTKRMAHHFLEAPDHFPVKAALRWGQVRGLGGSTDLADAVVATRLSRVFTANPFWLTVIQFLVNHPELSTTHVGPIIAYLHDQRFMFQEFLDAATGNIEWRPPQPAFSMKGRSPQALLRLVADWQRALPLRGKKAPFCWPRCAIGEFQLAESGIAGGGPRVWSIREILDSKTLRIEGNAMHHCVADYAGLCLKRETSIWSVSVQDQEARRRVLTVEVEPASKRVVQASRCCNEDPEPRDREILAQWAEQEGLKLEL